MDVSRVARERRTIRVFQDKKIPFGVLEKCVDAARFAPTAKNSQELEFIIIDDPSLVRKVDALAYFGGTIARKGSSKGFGPKAFIAIIANRKKSHDVYTLENVGIAAEAIALAAWEQGLGSCMMGAIEREEIMKALGVPEDYSLPLIIALGYPKEKPVLEESEKEGYPYWVDENNVLHVPKRPLKAVMHKNRF